MNRDPSLLRRLGRWAVSGWGTVRGSEWQQEAFIRSMIRDARNRVDLNTPLQEIRFVVFDLETTGFQPMMDDEIIAIGALPVENGLVKEEALFHTLVRPNRPIPPEITQLTGIADEDVRRAPPLPEALADWLRFIRNGTLVAYGARHDLSFIQTGLRRCWGTRLTHRVLDARSVAQWLHPEWPDHSLDRALAENGIPIRFRHTAHGDARMTAELWHRFLKRCDARGVKTLEELYAELNRDR